MSKKNYSHNQFFKILAEGGLRIDSIGIDFPTRQRDFESIQYHLLKVVTTFWQVSRASSDTWSNLVGGSRITKYSANKIYRQPAALNISLRIIELSVGTSALAVVRDPCHWRSKQLIGQLPCVWNGVGGKHGSSWRDDDTLLEVLHDIMISQILLIFWRQQLSWWRLLLAPYCVILSTTMLSLKQLYLTCNFMPYHFFSSDKILNHCESFCVPRSI